MKKFLFLTCIAIVAFTVAPAIAQMATESEFEKLDWIPGPTKIRIDLSKANIELDKTQTALTGDDAKEVMYLLEGHREFSPDAVVIQFIDETTITTHSYQFLEMGYIKQDDWDEHIDADDMFETIEKNTASANEKKKAGYPKLFLDKWVVEPYLDRQREIVFWATAGHSNDGNNFINARALKLSRKGVTVVTWIGDPSLFTSVTATLNPILDAYKHEIGYRYADFKPGVDTVAAVGAGALAYRMITGTSKKGASWLGAGLLAVVAAFLKKAWFLIFIPFVFAWGWVRRLFRSSN